jgi:pantetheine-phosphate adenylyltransferase
LSRIPPRWYFLQTEKMVKVATNKSVKKALYPGTFDPITYGHVDVIERSLSVFDEVTVLIAHSGKKSHLFDDQTRKSLVEKCFNKNSRVRVEIYDGLLANYAKENNFRTILRGLRGISDFEYEFQMASMNQRMNKDLQTFFLMASEKFFFLNSTLVKEVIAHGGDISELVPPHVEKHLKEKLC